MKNTLNLDFSNKASNVSFCNTEVTKIWGEGLGWTKADAEAVLADHTQYIHNLQSVGFRVSDIITSRVRKADDRTGYTIEEIEVNAGKDVADVLLASSDTEALLHYAEHSFRATAKQLLAIPPRDGLQYTDEHPWISVPADLKPHNVVIDSDSRMILIDTFGPKIWLDQKIKPLPSHTQGSAWIMNDEIKVGDIRFSLGRLTGYFIALSTRWLANQSPAAPLEDIDILRSFVGQELAQITQELLTDNPLFSATYAEKLISDSNETELVSIRQGTFEGPQYVQSLYEREMAVQE